MMPQWSTPVLMINSSHSLIKDVSIKLDLCWIICNISATKCIWHCSWYELFYLGTSQPNPIWAFPSHTQKNAISIYSCTPLEMFLYETLSKLLLINPRSSCLGLCCKNEKQEKVPDELFMRNYKCGTSKQYDLQQPEDVPIDSIDAKIAYNSWVSRLLNTIQNIRYMYLNYIILYNYVIVNVDI